MRHLYKIFVEYKWFSIPFMVMVLLLLSRIPLGTFNDPSALDVLGHFVMVATGTPLLMILMIGGRLLPTLKSAAHYIVVTSLLGISLEVIWEIFEFIIDASFQVSWQVSNSDTMADIILGVVGAVVGAAMFVKIYGIRYLSR